MLKPILLYDDAMRQLKPKSFAEKWTCSVMLNPRCKFCDS